MKFKANKCQTEALELVLRVLLEENQPADVAESLVYEIVFKAYTKIRAKVEALIAPRSGWGVSLTDQEAKALYVFYQQRVNPYLPGYAYEMIQLRTLYEQIDQQYGRITPTNSRFRTLASGTPPRLLGS